MHSINAIHQTVSNPVSNANCASFGGHSADCIGTISKRLLQTKRVSRLAAGVPQATGSVAVTGTLRMPVRAGRPRSMPTARPARSFTSCKPASSTAGETPAVVWAALVIGRALSS